MEKVGLGNYKNTIIYRHIIKRYKHKKNMADYPEIG